MTLAHKVFPLLLSLLLVGGCNATQPTKSDGAAGSTLARISQRGELVLGTSGNMPPMSQTLEDGKTVGFDVDLARLMATGMDVRLKIKTMPFDQLLPALERGDVDVVLSNMTMTTKRNMQVAFVGPYLTSGKCVITKRKNLAAAEEAGDLNTPDTRLAALRGSTSELFVKELLPQATLLVTDDHDSAIKLVEEGKAGGMIADYPICLSTVMRYPDSGFISLFSLLTYEPIGIALPGNDPLFVNWTENFMERLDATGLMDEVAKVWFGEMAVRFGE